ncbi:sialate O-acetylesterase [Pedobacter sp. GR22-6]|uniref:sialate O-acetylesterase n=1 Tax=Pedobacter sp. GR22-6 TaxID=3127957 RepID=UPI00307D0F6E
MKYPSLLLLCLFAVLTATAQVTLPSFFSDGMVLQQKSNVKLWGKAQGRKAINVQTSWDGKRYRVTADTSGRWLLQLPTPAAGGPYTIRISQQNQLQLSNILIGEVWLCSGQSNMDMPVKGYANSPIRDAAELLLKSPNPRIRLFHVERQYAAKAMTEVKGKWQEADAASVSEFSAAGYQFASFLSEHLKVPVGLIQSTWGGSPIEAWMDESALKEAMTAEQLKNDRAIGKAVHQVPGSLFNGMIAPLCGYGMAGVLWYQGEQNRYNYEDYLRLQPAMLKSWREHWGIGEWPFYYVQIAPMQYPGQQAVLAPRFREVQLKLMDLQPNSGMVVSIDGGEAHNIHPPDKTIIGQRLAFWALSNTYGKKAFAVRGPEYESMKLSHDTVSLKFRNVPLGLTSFGKTLTQFEVAGTDRVFYPANAVIKGSAVLVCSKRVPVPVAIRYAFKDWATGELYNVEGLPASSFRTDSW